MRLIRPLAACALALIGGCTDTTGLMPSALAKPPEPLRVLTAYVAVSDSAPELGSVIVVSGNVGGPSSERPVGSFRAELDYDPALLEFKSDASGTGAMIAMNPQNGTIKVAGASPTGIPRGQLFAVRFRVKDAAGPSSLSLHVLELNDVGYAKRVPGLVTQTVPKVDHTLK